MIVKIQKPIRTSGQPTMLVYNKSQEYFAEIPYQPEHDREIFQGRLKVYAKAREVNGQLVVDKIIPDQDW